LHVAGGKFQMKTSGGDHNPIELRERRMSVHSNQEAKLKETRGLVVETKMS